MRPDMRQRFLEGSLHLFGSRLRGNLRGHIVQVLFKIFGIPPVLTFKGARHDLSKVALSRHASGTSLRFKRGRILLRQVDRQVHMFLLQSNLSQCAPGEPPFCQLGPNSLE